MGGRVVYSKNNAILSEVGMGFSDRSSVAIRMTLIDLCTLVTQADQQP